VDISRQDLSRRYAALSDDELLAIDPRDLTDVAQDCYQSEVKRRRLSETPELSPDSQRKIDDSGDIESDWLKTAATVCSFEVGSGRRYAEDAEEACKVLADAGIPNQVVAEHLEGEGPDRLNVMVPGALSLKATSILERDLFNEELEETWRTHFEELSDEELCALGAEELCAGLLDCAARLKRVYEEALLRRNLQPN
jgi:hypothetical protein